MEHHCPPMQADDRSGLTVSLSQRMPMDCLLIPMVNFYPRTARDVTSTLEQPNPKCPAKHCLLIKLVNRKFPLFGLMERRLLPIPLANTCSTTGLQFHVMTRASL